MIKKSEPKDIPHILALIREFAEYEKLSDYCEVTEEKLRLALFGDGAVVESIIAFENETPVGYAIFYPNFASFRGQRGFYLEDIYVSQAARRSGVGEAMLRFIARLGVERGFERIDFQVLDWNAPAVRFYEKLGATRDDSERHFKFTDATFKNLAR